MKTTNAYTINFAKSTIVISKEYGKRASVYESKEYNELKNLCRDFPNYKIEYKTIERSSTKNSYAGLTYDRMMLYIELTNADRLQQLEHVIKVAAQMNGQYAFVKKWFLKEFPNYGKDEIEAA